MTTVEPLVGHPAKFSPSILTVLQEILDREADGRRLRILDPFAGVGGVHQLVGFETVGVELEPEWAGQHPQTEQGDATRLRFEDGSFDAVVTSISYGNRMADAYDGRDGSKRYTYRLALGRPLSAGSGSGLQWGSAYRRLHAAAFAEMRRVVRPGGLVVVNVSNHVRRDSVQGVVEWALSALFAEGLGLVEVRLVGTPRMRHGANGGVRVVGEHVLVLRKDA